MCLAPEKAVEAAVAAGEWQHKRCFATTHPMIECSYLYEQLLTGEIAGETYVKLKGVFGVVCGVVWCGVVWCGVVWCGVNRCEGLAPQSTWVRCEPGL
jgi:hypothetical protein